jgi:3-oxoacyl-[acyl-carrier protein] reductase
VSGRLQDRVAVVTGSGQGIGGAIAIAMAEEGARVVTNNRKPGTPGGDAETTARKIREARGQAVPFFGDVSDFEAARQLMVTAVDNFGRVDILVNNAGIASVNPVWLMTEEEWDKVVDASLKSSFNCIRHACGLMVEQGWGRIINTTSVGWLGAMERANYAAAKAGIVGLTWSVAKEAGSYGVTCNAYAPWVKTRMTESEDNIALWWRRYEAGLYTREQVEALRNLPGAETVLPLLVYLCTDGAADVNGQIFEVQGSKISVYAEPTIKKSVFKAGGLWAVDELKELVPTVLLEGAGNPAPSRVSRPRKSDTG